MKRLLSYILLTILGTFVLRAQADTLARADTLVTAPADTVAPQYSSILGLRMQSRYVPVNQPFNEEKSFLANAYVGLVGSSYNQFASNYSNGPYLTAFLGRWFTPVHGARVSAGAGYFMDNFTATRVKIVDTRLSYTFNLSAFVDGYNPNRMVEVSPIAGLGLSLEMNATSGTDFALGAHAGATVTVHALPGVDVVVEPLFDLTRDARKDPRMDVWHSYLIGFHGGVGLQYSLDRSRRGADPGKDWFYLLSGGVQFQNSKLAFADRGMTVPEAVGPALYGGAGRYYGDHAAMRVTAGYGTHFWNIIREGDTDIYNNPLTPGKLRSSCAALRLDFMLGVAGKHLAAYAFAGPEAGMLFKEDYDRPQIVYPYVGASAGIQAKVRVFRGISLFLEPRLSYVPYSANAFSSQTKNKNYYDAVVSLSMGLEVRTGAAYWKKKNTKYEE